jgi:hypothetical protein
MANCHLDCGKEIMVSGLTFKIIIRTLCSKPSKIGQLLASVSPVRNPLQSWQQQHVLPQQLARIGS